MKKFFRVVWRINAVVICVAGIAGLGLLVLILCSFLPAGHNAGIVPAQPGAAPVQKVKPIISKVETLDGTTIARATVQFPESGNEGSFSSARYLPATTCNYVFYDNATNKSQMLFPTNDRDIIQSDDFYFPSTPSENRVTKWIDYIFADKDTNKDGVISDDDLKSLALSRPDGGDYHVYLTDLDSVLNTQLIGENDFFAYYMQGQSVFVARIDLQQQKIVQTTKLF